MAVVKVEAMEMKGALKVSEDCPTVFVFVLFVLVNPASAGGDLPGYFGPGATNHRRSSGKASHVLNVQPAAAPNGGERPGRPGRRRCSSISVLFLFTFTFTFTSRQRLTDPQTQIMHHTSLSRTPRSSNDIQISTSSQGRELIKSSLNHHGIRSVPSGAYATHPDHRSLLFAPFV